MQTLVVSFFALRLQHALDSFKLRKNYTAALEAPSVSVCIPARNEMHALSECLEAVLASDYPKLEIIVFDDDSGDDTSVIVRSFAHAGVRFVPGAKLPEGWLGKNHALDTLAREASGTYVVFLDVDTRIQPTTISQLMGYVMTENLSMTSVIPRRNDTWRASVLFAPLRYFWQLILHRMLSPASSSSLWMIHRETLMNNLGGFTPHKSEVEPEAHIAMLLGKKYHCLLGNETLGVSYEKKWTSQMETARRVLYPMIGGTWLRGVGAFALLLFLDLPLVMLLASLMLGWSFVGAVALWTMISFMAVYGMYTSKVWRKAWWLGALLWPVVVTQETVLLVMSVWGYVKHSITWKGRSVTARASRDDFIVIDT
jgi:chlorobactene glucosyltransferase